jgi:3alpha(or 20beta)-hydroxysteroid dehydrogenase
MRTSGGGSIVNVGSVGSLMALPNKSAYLSSKYGLRGVTKCAASELGQHGIRVNAIQPGGIASDMTEGMPSATFADMPIPRIGLPSETAAAVLFFASDESTYCTGAELAVDGGRLVAPMATPPQPAAEKLGPPRIDA